MKQEIENLNRIPAEFAIDTAGVHQSGKDGLEG